MHWIVRLPPQHLSMRKSTSILISLLALLCLCLCLCLCLFLSPSPLNALDQPTAADVALIVSVDVSESVDEARYRLQMDGIAKALEDPAVIDAITSGPKGRILFAMVVWADHAQLAVAWTPISSASESISLANTVRHLERYGGEFTCLARMLSNLNDTVLDSMPMKATRTVVDVSGDGIDNCSPDATTREARDELVKRGVTINGLPIIEEPGQIVGAGAYRAPDGNLENLRPLESRERLTLDGWYRTNVMGGDLAFILPANGYADFARAMRQKFVTEISNMESLQPSRPNRHLPNRHVIANN